MSFKYADEIWKQTKQVRGRLILLVAIARYANEYGLAYPSIETLASDTHTSTRQVKRNIKALVEAGELFVKLGQGRGHFTKYLILNSALRNRDCQGTKPSTTTQ
jgi:predicted unusual protein kinase regulating ubiquinone biosynthesis (AarF/ABC1/UbiB family)